MLAINVDAELKLRHLGSQPVFGYELARLPESSLTNKVAQGCGLLPVDSAGETVGVVSEVTGEEKIEGNGVEGIFNNDMTDDEMFGENSQQFTILEPHVWSRVKCAVRKMCAPLVSLYAYSNIRTF